MKRKIYLLIFLLMFFFVTACALNLGGSGTNNPSLSQKAGITAEVVDEILVGNTTKINYTLNLISGEVTFKSSNEKIATVDEEGVVLGIAKGKTIITLTCTTSDEKYTTEVTINVVEEKSEHQHVKCSICSKCTSSDCDGELYERCQGHEEEIPVHDCEDYASDWIDKEPFSCGESGKQVIICTKCNEVLQEKTILKEHSYESKVLQEKTCTKDGKVEYTCSICYDNYIKTDYAKGHVESDITISVPATENTLGTKQILCLECEEVFKEFNYLNNAYHKNGKLSVKGPDLVNQFGEKYQLFGLSTHGLQWFSRVVNFDTICEIQENFGNNVIRFALYTDEDGYCDGGPSKKQYMLETLQKGIDIATELGLYVIVDWHMVGADNPADKNPLTYLEESKEFFSYISEYYKDQDNILYEIMNEPNGSTTWADCKKYANEVIPCIRKNTDAVILVGNPKWTADLNSVMKDPLVGYENIMYTYHFYAADHSSTTQVVKAYDSGFPVFISEFGFMESSGDGAISETNGEKWKKVLDPRNISYVAWNISNSPGSASIFKNGTTKLDDVSDENLKVWGVYLKNWYRAKSLNIVPEPEEIPTANIELMTEVPEWTSNYECFIISTGSDSSRLNYNWSSSNEGVLTVSEYSTLKIIGDGSCSIIAKHKTNGDVGVLDIVVKNGEIVSFSSRYTE